MSDVVSVQALRLLGNEGISAGCAAIGKDGTPLGKFSEQTSKLLLSYSGFRIAKLA